MTEDAIADGEARHLGTDLGDRAHRYIAERTREALQPDVWRPRDIGAPGEVIRPVGDGIVAVTDQLGAMLGRGKLGLDSDLCRSKWRIFVLTELRCPGRGRDQF